MFSSSNDRKGCVALGLQRKQYVYSNISLKLGSEVSSMEEPLNQEERMSDQAKSWLQDNLRIVVSVFIVAAIALGIYSYSQRSSESLNDEMLASTTDESVDAAITEDSVAAPEETSVSSGSSTTNVAPGETSRETATSFVVSAEKGDGMTHLARRALMDYLEKNPDSRLSGEHKVYIEDWLRKQHPRSPVYVGSSVEFSKDMIRQAIDQSQTLTPNQLQNLKKYSDRVALYRS